MSQSAAGGYPRPSLSDNIQLAQADFNRLPGADATLRRAVLNVLAKSSAALVNGEYGYLNWMVNNCLIPDSLTGSYLDRWLAIKGTKRIGATSAVGNVIFLASPNIVIPAGTQLQNSDGSVTVATTAPGSVALGSNPSTVSIPAVASAGSAGNLAANAPLTMLVGIAGVSAQAVVDGNGFSGGNPQETDEQAQVRLLGLLSAPPAGGKASDYVNWAKLVPGVTRVWVYPVTPGLGFVSVSFTMDGRADIIPLAADVAAVQARCALYAPETATPIGFAPTPHAIEITISNLVAATGYTLATAQANAQAALVALFLTTSPGGTAYSSVTEQTQAGGALLIEQIDQAIANAPGVATFDLTIPSVDIQESTGVISILGTVTFA